VFTSARPEDRTAVSLKHHVFWCVTPDTLILNGVSKIRSAIFRNVRNYYRPYNVTSTLLGLPVPENEGAAIFSNIENYLPQRNIPEDLNLYSTHLSGFSITYYESNKPHDFKARTSPNHRHS
jgi:hypothetical protein